MKKLSKGQSFAGNYTTLTVRPKIPTRMGQRDQSFTKRCEAVPTAIIDASGFQYSFSGTIRFGILNPAKLAPPNIFDKDPVCHAIHSASARALRQAQTVLDLPGKRQMQRIAA